MQAPEGDYGATVRPSAEALARWCVETALLFGCSVATAHHVAALFVEAVVARWAEADERAAREASS